MRSAGWELGFEPADEGKDVKPQLNAGKLAFKGGTAHIVLEALL
jgi:hypothetical protein